MKKVKIRAGLIMLTGFALGFIGIAMDETPAAPVLAVLCLASFFAYFAYIIKAWRCPSCHRMLPHQGSLGMEYCPYCGERLD